MLKKYFLQYVVFLLFLFSISLFGQQDSYFALYKYHMQVINPAYTGSQEGAYVNSTFRSQWVGIAQAPRIQAISLGIPSSEKRLSYGALVYNNKTFVEQFSQFYANFSYRLPLQPELDLYLGLSAGGQNFSINFNELQNIDHANDIFFNPYSRFNPNVGVGAYLKAKNYYLSFSIPKLFQTKRFNEADGFNFSARDLVHVYGSLGGKIPLSTDWFWVNSVLVRYVSNAPWSVVTNTGVAFKENELTFGYQWDGSYAGTLMVRNIGFISVGYSYQFSSNNALASLTHGNHELLIKIRLGKPNKAPEIQEESEQQTEKDETNTPIQ